jgi:cytochrome oxidase assembly protein ShyY1
MESETEKAGRFSPPSRLDTSKNESNDNGDRIQKLLWLDRQAIAEMTNCPSGSEPPLFVQIRNGNAGSDTTFPVRSSREYVGEFKVTPEVHVGYATTWFGLSGAGIMMTRKLFSKGR